MYSIFISETNMTKTQKVLIKTVLASLAGAAMTYGLLVFLSKKQGFFQIGSPHSLSDATPDPLPYDSIGNFPPLENAQGPVYREKEFTLELGSCETKTCIAKTLQSLSKKGVEAFYTPFKEDGTLIFRIRSYVFSQSRKCFSRYHFASNCRLYSNLEHVTVHCVFKLLAKRSSLIERM